jgi:ribosomal-protein-alanine N-acetyltransferase
MSAARFRVRAADAADLAEVVALERGIAEAPHWAQAEYGAIVGAAQDGDGAVRRCFFVAEEEGGLVGFAVGKVIGLGVQSVAELESVAVKAAERRGGVGRALCLAVIEWCRGQMATALELEVRVESVGAIAMYAGLGFVTVGRRVGYYRDPAEDAVMMRLDLSGM